MHNTALPRPTTEERAHTLFNRVMESAPMGLLVCAALGLTIVGVFQFIYYFSVLPGGWNFTLITAISTALATFFEALGFYFLVTTVRDFSSGARKEGWIGLCATFLLWGYALWECRHIAARFSAHTPETYWSILGIIATITCIVRVVEFRIALTVTSAVQRKNALAEAENALDQERKRALELTGKLAHFEQAERTEKQRIQEETEQREKERAEAESLRRQQAWDALQQEAAEARSEVERLRRAAERAEKKAPGIPIVGTGRADMEREAAKFFLRNNIHPTQQQVAEMVGLKDAKSVRLQFPNGSWEAFLGTLEAESLSAQN